MPCLRRSPGSRAHSHARRRIGGKTKKKKRGAPKITNPHAVLEALAGKQSAFARTPKYRVESKKDKVRASKYRKRLGWVPWLELVIGAYFALAVYYAVTNENYITVPFLD